MSDPAAPTGVRQAARDRAKELRDQHRKQDRRRRLIVTGSIVLGTILVLAVVATVLVTLSRPTARGPANMQSDGIKIGAGLRAEQTPALEAGEQPIASKKNAASVLDIKLYVDYMCQDCGTFFEKDGDQLQAFVDSGAATVEIHPLAVLTTKSGGTQYSLRAANAAACVAEFSPNTFFAFNAALFDKQPKEGTDLTDGQILQRATEAKVTRLGQVQDCLKDQRFRSWVQSATSRALAGPLPGTTVPSVKVTPTILVNGKQFAFSPKLDAADFAAFIQQASGEVYSKNPTPTPSATPTP